VGAVKRVNQILIRELKKLCDYGARSWDTYLEKATLALKISFNRSINIPPFIIKNEHLPDLAIDVKLNKINFKRDKIRQMNLKDKPFNNYAKLSIIREKSQLVTILK
jgi:hypothetical protein